VPLNSEARRTAHQLKQLDAQRDATVDAVDARARSVLGAHSLVVSRAIALSREAAAAAHENYTKVADAYARGVVSITDLISAQDAALNAELSQAAGDIHLSSSILPTRFGCPTALTYSSIRRRASLGTTPSMRGLPLTESRSLRIDCLKGASTTMSTKQICLQQRTHSTYRAARACHGKHEASADIRPVRTTVVGTGQYATTSPTPGKFARATSPDLGFQVAGK